MIVVLEAIVGAVAVGSIYTLIVARWRRGVWWLMAYIPFAGAVANALAHWWPSLVFKDILFVIPVYIGVFARVCLRRERLLGFPTTVAFLMIALGILATIQTTNPGVLSPMMALIGLKVWLFYLPLSLVAYCFVESLENLQALFRMLTGLSFLPFSLAFVELGLVHHFGYRPAMTMVYGAVAGPVTQQFSDFEIGRGLLVRIPSTFTFVTQFFLYSLATLAPAYAVWRTDPSPWWRRAGAFALTAAAASTFVSGERAAWVLTPLALALIFWMDKGLAGLITALGYGISIVCVTTIGLLGIGIHRMYLFVGHLFVTYGRSLAIGGLVKAIGDTPLGAGTGTNTGAAVHAFSDPHPFFPIENYYAKAVVELGIPGLAIVVGLFLAIVITGSNTRNRIHEPVTRHYASIILAFIMCMLVSSFKGWLIDLDPINVYFWVFSGILFKLKDLDFEMRPTQLDGTSVATLYG